MLGTYLKNNYKDLTEAVDSRCGDIFVALFLPNGIYIAFLLYYAIMTGQILAFIINFAFATIFSAFFILSGFGDCTMSFLTICWFILFIMPLFDGWKLFLIILPIEFIISLMTTLFTIFQHQFHNK